MDGSSSVESLSREELEQAKQPLSAFLDSPRGAALFVAALPASLLSAIGASVAASGGFQTAYALSKGVVPLIVPMVLAALLLIATYPVTRTRSRESLRHLRGWLVLLVLAAFWTLLTGWHWPPIVVLATWLVAGGQASGLLRNPRLDYYDRLLDKADARMKLDRPLKPLRTLDRLRLALALAVWWAGWVVFPAVFIWRTLHG